jgi:hypothetical protein
MHVGELNSCASTYLQGTDYQPCADEFAVSDILVYCTRNEGKIGKKKKGANYFENIQYESL